MQTVDLFLLLAVLLPPRALDAIGPVTEERMVETPFGTVGPVARRKAPNAANVWIGPYSGLPTRTDPRATVYAAKELGVRRILNWDRAIGINPLLRRGQPLIATDYIDWMRGQSWTFLEGEHADFNLDEVASRPAFCPELTTTLQQCLPFAVAGIYLGVDGPRRETAAEAHMFRHWGADVIGQNMVPEVSLAQELGLCYAGLATVINYSVDQQTQRVDGEVRHSLELTVQSLRSFIERAGSLPTCNCGASFGG
jgi:5'-methylthioadenosine phosphorylase